MAKNKRCLMQREEITHQHKNKCQILAHKRYTEKDGRECHSLIGFKKICVYIKGISKNCNTLPVVHRDIYKHTHICIYSHNYDKVQDKLSYYHI